MDISIAVGAALAQFVTAYWGWQVAATDPALTAKEKNKYTIKFMITGLVGIALVGVAAYRGERTERAHFAIQASTALQPIPFIADKNLLLDINYHNVGTGTAYNFLHAERAYIENDDSLISQKKAVETFKSDLTKPTATGTTVSKDEQGFITAWGPMLSPEDVDNLQRGRRVALAVGEMRYEDDFGSHDKTICFMVQPPPGSPIIFKNCDGQYNQEH
ncbi:MAG TPA: hypothetical protein VN517_17690 [Terriglobales bacterium]|nr:hypothetical protein [Terriglobales bacterium]